MRSLNALIGVRHGRTKDPLRVEVHHPETGRSYVLSEARQVRHAEPLVLDDWTVDGVRNLDAVASTQEQADEFVRRIRAEGKPVTVKRERVPLLFASPPTTTVSFGGPMAFRAVARVTLNVFAHHYPGLARMPWLDAFKRFIREGDGDFVAYEYRDGTDPEPGLPDDSFVFQHRFVLGQDSTSGLVYAHVSLLGMVELAVRLGVTELSRNETLVHDVDVTADAPPDDVRVQRIADVALLRPGLPTPDPTVHWRQRLERLAQKRADILWNEDAPALVRALNAARELPPTDRHRHIAATLEGQRQRLLNLAAYVRVALRQHLAKELGEEAAQVADALGVLVQGDGKSKTGVTDVTKVHADMLCYVMADALVGRLQDHPLTETEVRSMLEGHVGAAVVGRYMVGELHKTHPFFRQ